MSSFQRKLDVQGGFQLEASIERHAAAVGAQATRDRSAVKTAGGKIIRVEAHPIPEHPRPRRVKGRVSLVGDAAGYVTKCSGVCLSTRSFHRVPSHRFS